MTDMIEKVARAIYEMRAFGALPTWEKIGDYDRALYLDMARAAIEAMREPTDAMVLAGCRKSLPSIFAHGLEGLPTDGPNTQQAMAKVRAAVQAGHAAMIDAALSD